MRGGGEGVDDWGEEGGRRGREGKGGAGEFISYLNLQNAITSNGQERG